MPRPRLLLILSAAWFSIVLFSYHFGWGSEGFPARTAASALLDAALLGIVGVGAWGLGRAALRRFEIAARSPGEAPLFELGAGLGVLALAVLGVAAVSLLYREAIAGTLIVGILLLWRGRSRSRPRTSSHTGAGWTGLEIALGGVLATAGLATLAASLAPPEFYDALIYHLAVPAFYLRHHGLAALPGNYYASFPANMGMLYAVGLALHGGPLAQSLHWLCGAAATAALVATTSRHFDRPTGWLAGALFALTPGVMLVSTYAIADLGVTLFGMLCFAAVLNLWREPERRWLVLAGVFAGLAIGTKYTAALVVCLPAMAAIAFRPRGQTGGARAKRAIVELTVFASLVMLLAAPWLARNLVLEGNPVAPYLRAAGEGSSPGIAQEIARRLPKQAGATALIMHYLSAPWTVTMQRLGAGGYLTPTFLMLVPLLVFLRRRGRAVWPVALMAFTGFAAWALTTQVTRYLLPVLPLIAILAATAARRLPRAITIGVVAWSLFYGFFLYMFFIETIGGYRVMTGAETRDEYLSRRVSYYPAVKYLDSTAPDARVLFLGEGRGFYCPRDYVASTPFDRPAIERYVTGSSEQRLLDALRADRITHLLVSDPELRRTRGMSADEYMGRYFPSGSPRLLFEQNGVSVYALPDRSIDNLQSR